VNEETSDGDLFHLAVSNALCLEVVVVVVVKEPLNQHRPEILAKEASAHGDGFVSSLPMGEASMPGLRYILLRHRLCVREAYNMRVEFEGCGKVLHRGYMHPETRVRACKLQGDSHLLQSFMARGNEYGVLKSHTRSRLRFHFWLYRSS
jgi:hypothetical protein